MATAGPRGDARTSAADVDPRANEFARRLAGRAALIARGLLDLEAQLRALEDETTPGAAREGGADPRLALRDAIAGLRNELRCLDAARQAVATLRRAPRVPDLASLRAERAALPGSQGRRSP